MTLTRSTPGAVIAMTSTRSAAEDLIAVATTFMAHQPGAAQRALARHTPLPDGRCSGCPHPTTRWPCFVAAIALRVESITRRGPSATQELGP